MSNFYIFGPLDDETEEYKTQNNKASISPGQLKQQLAYLRKKVGAALNNEVEKEEVSKYKLGIIPPKTSDWKKMVTEGDNFNFEALCRGVDLLPANIVKGLKCYFSTQGDHYYKLHPLQVRHTIYYLLNKTHK